MLWLEVLLHDPFTCCQEGDTVHSSLLAKGFAQGDPALTYRSCQKTRRTKNEEVGKDENVGKEEEKTEGLKRRRLMDKVYKG